MKPSAYHNSVSRVSLTMPESWTLAEDPNLQVGNFAIDLFPKHSKAAMHTPLGMHCATQYSYVAIWPHGTAAAWPKGERFL